MKIVAKVACLNFEKGLSLQSNVSMHKKKKKGTTQFLFLWTNSHQLASFSHFRCGSQGVYFTMHCGSRKMVAASLLLCLALIATAGVASSEEPGNANEQRSRSKEGEEKEAPSPALQVRWYKDVQRAWAAARDHMQKECHRVYLRSIIEFLPYWRCPYR